MDSQILIITALRFSTEEPKTVCGNVLITVNNPIEKSRRDSVQADPAGGVQVLDGKGRFLMPGLIDAHWHAYLCCNTMQDRRHRPSYTHLAAGRLGDPAARVY